MIPRLMPALLRHYAPAILSGVLMFWAFPRFHWFVLAWVGLVPLIYACAHATPWASAQRFFVAGWVFHTLVLQWLVTNIYWAGGWAILGQQALVLALALFWGLTGFAWAFARRRNGKLAGALLLALLWTGLEWAHAHLFTGFGWCALGYTQGPDLPLLQWAAIGGVHLISFFLVLFNALIALALAEPWRALLPRIAAAFALLIMTHGLGYLLVSPADEASKPFKAVIAQANFPQQMRWDPTYTEEMVAVTVSHSQRVAAASGVDLFVWPEALVTDHYERPELYSRIRELTIYNDAPLFSGVTRRAGAQMYNSSILVDATGEVVDHYDKVHLVPFGEYLPLADLWPALRGIVLADVAPGFEQKVLPLDDETMIGPLICFEVLDTGMTEHLRRMKADMLVVVTNLGWFGQSNAVSQELEIARLRAVETRLPLIHSANTGISGVFDPWGRFKPIGYNNPNIAGNPNILTQNRYTDAVPVAQPGRRPIPYLPTFLPALLPILGILLLAFAILNQEAIYLEPEMEIEETVPKEEKAAPTFVGLDRVDSDFMPDNNDEKHH